LSGEVALKRMTTTSGRLNATTLYAAVKTATASTVIHDFTFIANLFSFR
jgi:hypothetical protein